MRCRFIFISLALVAIGALADLTATATEDHGHLNSTIVEARNQLGQPYYAIGINIPLCVPTSGYKNLCTTTIVGSNALEGGWVYLFSHDCSLWHFDPMADWKALGYGTYQIWIDHLPVPVNVHSNKDQFMQNIYNDNFWVQMNGWQQNWSDRSFWDQGWAGGGQSGIYEMKRMVWVCFE